MLHSINSEGMVFWLCCLLYWNTFFWQHPLFRCFISPWSWISDDVFAILCMNGLAPLACCMCVCVYVNVSTTPVSFLTVCHHSREIEITAEVLEETDKLVQLIESPIFTGDSHNTTICKYAHICAGLLWCQGWVITWSDGSLSHHGQACDSSCWPPTSILSWFRPCMDCSCCCHRLRHLACSSIGSAASPSSTYSHTIARRSELVQNNTVESISY